MSCNFSVADTPFIWFDLDDTVWDFRNNSLDTLREFYEARALDRFWPSPGEWIDSYHAYNGPLWVRYGKGEISLDYLRLQRFIIPFAEAGVHISEAEAGEFDADYLDRLSRRTRLVPGALDLIARLHAGGFTLGIISNGFADTQRRKLQSSGIERYFSHLVLSEDAGEPKPSPVIFRYAEKVSGAGPRQCVLIGDNPDTDIAGAINAGWQAFLVSDILG